MGKAARIRERNIRERIAAQQAAAQRAEARRRAFLAFGSVLAVVVVVVGLIFIKTLEKPAKASAAKSVAAVETAITTVPASALNSVGKGTAAALTPTKGSPPILTSDGKPEILYMGAEYCPYCAAERWALAVALSRFGKLSNLHFIHSSSTDVYPDTPTLSFYHSTYTSKYIVFTPVEMYGLEDNGKPLQKPTAAESALMAKYDAAPYVPSSDAGAFPFVDFGNQYLVLGAQYVPSDLSKLTWADVAADLKNPASPVAQDIDGAANTISAAICKITKDAPAAVCNSAAVKSGEGSL
jgi:thiol-disulfide isomerase/thioredoxin